MRAALFLLCLLHSFILWRFHTLSMLHFRLLQKQIPILPLPAVWHRNTPKPPASKSSLSCAAILSASQTCRDNLIIFCSPTIV